MKSAVISKERMYEVVRGPIITEKATLGSEHNQVTFRVAIDANKNEIKTAIEGLFDVKVRAVNTSRMKGKVKRLRARLGKRVATKKAMVTLEEGQSLDISTGI